MKAFAGCLVPGRPLAAGVKRHRRSCENFSYSLFSPRDLCDSLIDAPLFSISWCRIPWVRTSHPSGSRQWKQFKVWRKPKARSNRPSRSIAALRSKRFCLTKSNGLFAVFGFWFASVDHSGVGPREQSCFDNRT
jgi:hypothetical protein